MVRMRLFNICRSLTMLFATIRYWQCEHESCWRVILFSHDGGRLLAASKIWMKCCVYMYIYTHTSKATLLQVVGYFHANAVILAAFEQSCTAHIAISMPYHRTSPSTSWPVVVLVRVTGLRNKARISDNIILLCSLLICPVVYKTQTPLC